MIKNTCKMLFYYFSFYKLEGNNCNIIKYPPSTSPPANVYVCRPGFIAKSQSDCACIFYKSLKPLYVMHDRFVMSN